MPKKSFSARLREFQRAVAEVEEVQHGFVALLMASW